MNFPVCFLFAFTTVRLLAAADYVNLAADNRVSGAGPSKATGGASYYLNPASAKNEQNGTAEAPWKSFDAAQSGLKPGDTLYCAGELGAVTMANTYPAGTATDKITYKKWPAHDQPHITTLKFSEGTRRNWYVVFEEFKFAPGEVDTADYVTNNAIKLDGAAHVEINKCFIEGARLNVPVKGADPHYGVDSAKGFFPYTPLASLPPPAVTAGSPGNACHITINDCDITNSAIGIMVSEDYRAAPKEARHWVITRNRITNTSEDAIRIGGGGASGTAAEPSLIADNTISDQNTYKEAFNWAGDGDPEVWNSRKWRQVRQEFTKTRNGVVSPSFSTAVIYHAEALPNGPSGQKRMRLFVLADDRDHVPDRSRTENWVLVEDPSLFLHPSAVDAASKTLKDSSGDSAHTDCISIMGPSHDVLISRNFVKIADAGGPLKVEGIKSSGKPAGSGHPYNITFENNLFYSYGISGSGVILAGGRDIVFRHNVIFSGPDAPLGRATRFNRTSADEEPVPNGVHFYNNIIGGGGSTTPANAGYRNLAKTENNLWLSQPLEGYNDASTHHLGPGDIVVPNNVRVDGVVTVKGWESVKFHDPKGVLDDGIPDFSLDPGSPAINLGNPARQTTDNKDITGYVRHDGAPDAGAYEVQTP